MQITDFNNQSELIVGYIMQNYNMDRENAMKAWYNSRTYSEIYNRRLFYVSATRAYSELLMEWQNSDEWMRDPFDM